MSHCQYATMDGRRVTCSNEQAVAAYGRNPHIGVCKQCPHKKDPTGEIWTNPWTKVVKATPGQRFITDAQKSLANERKIVCGGCEHQKSMTDLTVSCGACGCGGVPLYAEAKRCPRGKWEDRPVERLVLRSKLSPGDILMMTAAIRDLHAAHPGKYLTDVDTPAREIWDNNPHVTKHDGQPARLIDLHYPLINGCNQKPYHFIHGYRMDLEQKLGISIPAGDFKGAVYLSDDEKRWTSQVEAEFGHRGPFWILMAGGKYDFTAKWWNPASYQAVVDHFKDRVTFVQCGEKHHWHTPLNGTLDLIGKTNLRQFIRLMYHAEGVICPVTFAMHLAAAVPTKTGRLRPCVVLSGGREPPHWEAYPGHQFLHTIGMLKCCANGGCWKSRCQKVGDGDKKDKENLCEMPVNVGRYPVKGRETDVAIPKCMDMITPQRVIEAVEGYVSNRQAVAIETKPVERERVVGQSNGKQFSVLIGCYGDHFNLSGRSIQSVLNKSDRSKFDFYVGCSECCKQTRDIARSLHDDGMIDGLVESNANINKDPMMRLLIDMVRTPYLLWLDDDTHVLPGWDTAVQQFIESKAGQFECAGHVFYHGRNDAYREFLHKRPWWRGDEHYLKPDHKERVWFATGGYWLASTAFLRKHDFPDRGMVKKQDDLLLGDLISQQHARLINFNKEIMETVRISDSNRRGAGEGKDGWLNVNTATGF